MQNVAALYNYFVGQGWFESTSADTQLTLVLLPVAALFFVVGAMYGRFSA